MQKHVVNFFLFEIKLVLKSGEFILQNIVVLIGIRSFHHFVPIGFRTVECRRTSESGTSKIYHL